MANSKGGVILLGVEDDGSVSGVRNVSNMERDFWATINNRGKVSHSLLTPNDVKVVEHPKGPILAFRIPRASYKQRPIFIGQNPLTGTFRRYADGDYHCREQEVRRMISDSSDESADSHILENFGLDDLDMASVQQYRQRFSAFHPTHTWLGEKIEGFLLKLGGWNYSDNGSQGPSLAGLLMFGKDESIRRGCPAYFVDYRERLSEDLGIRWTDRLIPDGTWTGNLFQFYTRVIQKLSADLKLPFQLDDKLFRKGETVVHVAVREALVNALIHSDFYGEGGIIIEKYKDRFEFSNPGSLLISFEQLLQGGISICRNKSLQLMFTMIGAAEHAGSGIDKIRAGWQSQHWREPLFKETVNPERVLWKLPMVSLIPEESIDRLKKRFGKNFSKFNQLEIQALVTADVEGNVDNARMRQITNSHPTDITHLLQRLVSKKALIQDGQGRATRYSLPSLLDSAHKHSDSAHSAQTADLQWLKLMEIASQFGASQRLPPQSMKNILLELCRHDWLTARELSDLTNRHYNGLRYRYLTPMVNEGLLMLRYPNKPNRADQAYKAITIDNDRD
ncbi:MAG: putative DNA binding domain-containing protein [Rhabdochlamydiaceae bacterium]|nr:putative DNA binding domain-containing protein [Rhabdochlamydiaceae bacterium]